jgi:hypothetical protein
MDGGTCSVRRARRRGGKNHQGSARGDRYHGVMHDKPVYTHKNGVLVSTAMILVTDSMEGSNTTSTVAIGTHPSYIDDLTITIGTARHSSANFSVYP